jgi:hypothetical protein
MPIQKIAATVLAAGSLAAVPLVASATNGDGGLVTYRVTIENVATGAQPLSPGGVVIHGGDVDVWSAGSPASAAVAAVAEDANLPIYVGTYSAAPGVKDAFVGGGDVPFGQTEHVTFEFDAKRNDRISVVSMLVNTNDAFTGLDSVRLGNESQVFEVGAYDAGTETNTELMSDIPGQGSPFVHVPEGAVITPHGGIVGQVGDIDPIVYDWDGPVAQITITPLG